MHGTSAHVSYRGPVASSNSWTKRAWDSPPEENWRVGPPPETSLLVAFGKLGHSEVTVYGEAYGGKCQGMRETYGEHLRFIAFDVQVGCTWLSVPDMVQVIEGLGLEVVPWRETSTDLTDLDSERDRPSEVAVLRGVTTSRPREGVVLRPPFEVMTNNGERVMAKHKGAAFEERATPPKVVDPSKLVVLAEAGAVAAEWVTPMRLTHVLDKIPGADISKTPQVISAMVEDVYREAAGEIVESKEVRTAIGRRTAELFNDRLSGRSP